MKIYKKIVSVLVVFSILISLGFVVNLLHKNVTVNTANAIEPTISSQVTMKQNYAAKGSQKTRKQQTTTAATSTATQSATTTSSTTQSTSATTTNTTTTTTIPSGSNKIVLGYYASWAAYSGYTPDKIDGSKLTFINYAFANIGSDLKIAVGDTYIDPSNFTKLAALKTKYPNLKTMISVGGWSWSAKFSDAALTDASRAAFADSCVAFIKKYGFDGVDIDWEYPVSGGMSTNVYRSVDKTNFTLLMQQLRSKLSAQGTIDGKRYYLSFAGGCGTWHVNNLELSKLYNIVDYATIMTYDIHASWDAVTDFNSPLYTTTTSNPNYKWSVNDGVNLWLANGFGPSKLIMGVPFYGYIFSGVNNANNGLYQNFTSGKSITYNSVVTNYLTSAGYTLYRDPQTMVPCLWNGSTFISFDDPQSITAKANYAVSKGLAGAGIWDISQDKNNALLTALFNGLN